MIVHQTPLLDGNHKSSGGTSGESPGGMITGTTPDTRRGHDVVQAIPGCTAEDCASLNGCSGKTFISSVYSGKINNIKMQYSRVRFIIVETLLS